MERVYSAFFTVDRPASPPTQQQKQKQAQQAKQAKASAPAQHQTPQLTAEALEKHNESLANQQKRSSTTSGVQDPRSLSLAPACDNDASDPARRRSVASKDDSEHAAARRRDLAQLTLNYYEIKRDVKSALKAALRGTSAPTIMAL